MFGNPQISFDCACDGFHELREVTRNETNLSHGSGRRKWRLVASRALIKIFLAAPQGEWLDRRMSNQRFEKQRQFLQNRLSPEGYAGLHLTIGVLVVLLAGWWFGAIAEDLSPDNPLVLFDQRVAVWFHQHATTTLTHVAKAITFFGSVLGLTILSVAVALVFIVSRAWFNLFVFAVMMTGESLLNVLLKHLFHRHRPVLENPLVTLTSYGFPSGHTMGVTVLFGLLALFLAKTVSTAGAAFAYFIAAGLVILLIGLTRVYLGAHFLSDVLGAFAASVVWLTFCWTAFETLRRRQKHRSE